MADVLELSDQEFEIAMNNMLRTLKWTEKWTTCKNKWVVYVERWEFLKNQKKMIEINNIIIEMKIEIKNTVIKVKNAFDGLISTG